VRSDGCNRSAKTSDGPKTAARKRRKPMKNGNLKMESDRKKTEERGGSLPGVESTIFTFEISIFQ
jgi:hypothetical protein